MAVKIRLSRGGTKKRPYYYIVVANGTSPRDGRYIEQIGTYNPMLPKDNPDRVKLDVERAKHWLSVGAQPTDRVMRFLDAAGIAKRTPSNNPEKAKPKKKRLEREAAAADAAANAAEAARPSPPPGCAVTPEGAPAHPARPDRRCPRHSRRRAGPQLHCRPRTSAATDPLTAAGAERLRSSNPPRDGKGVVARLDGVGDRTAPRRSRAPSSTSPGQAARRIRG